MKREFLLKEIAENAYNVLYGAKKHFATYDIVTKVPNRISLLTLLIGIIQLCQPTHTNNVKISLLLILVSICGLEISKYYQGKKEYEEIANNLIQYYNQLRDLYYQVKSSKTCIYNSDSKELKEMKNILNKYYDESISKQIIFSDWLAHYKLFAQHQYEWINEQKHFTWKDKVPLSLRLVISILLLIVVVVIIKVW